MFNYTAPSSTEVPVLISVPHCGTEFPAEIRGEYRKALINKPDDTDWFVDRLYDFAADLGMPMISARCSRWVIDLNRDPLSKPLYDDGRIITALCPVTTFTGEPLYNDLRKSVRQEEVTRRLTHYYHPYHQKIAEELTRLKNKFGVALLWDCHSIRQYVPTVYPDKFPDLILGDADGSAASSWLSDGAAATLNKSDYSFQRNHPFKGGHITRHFGKPLLHQHALQLEMTKVNYMDDTELSYSEERALKMRNVLIATFNDLIRKLTASASV